MCFTLYKINNTCVENTCMPTQMKTNEKHKLTTSQENVNIRHHQQTVNQQYTHMDLIVQHLGQQASIYTWYSLTISPHIQHLTSTSTDTTTATDNINGRDNNYKVTITNMYRLLATINCILSRMTHQAVHCTDYFSLYSPTNLAWFHHVHQQLLFSLFFSVCVFTNQSFITFSICPS